MSSCCRAGPCEEVFGAAAARTGGLEVRASGGGLVWRYLLLERAVA